jgi:hypothetical protein
MIQAYNERQRREVEQDQIPNSENMLESLQETTKAPPSSPSLPLLIPTNSEPVSEQPQEVNAQSAHVIEEEEVKGGSKDGSPQTSHKNAFIRTSDNTPEEKDIIGSKFEETVMSFLDIKENLSENDSSSSCSPCSCSSFEN